MYFFDVVNTSLNIHSVRGQMCLCFVAIKGLSSPEKQATNGLSPLEKRD